MNILHVEDNPLDADLVRRALTAANAGFQVTAVATLAQAQARLCAEPAFDLVLIDIGLPDGNGLELVRAIRAQGLPLALVALTGQGDEDLAVAALKAGANDYLAKRAAYGDRLPTTLRAAWQRFGREQVRQRRGLRVLYAEHQAVDVDLTCRHFAAHAPHIQLDVVLDSAAALRQLPQGPAEASAVDVLLLDYRLTPENGLDLLKHVRGARGLDLPVVVVTGQGSEDVATEALRLGASDYVVKHANYLFGLPLVLENAFHRVSVERERALLRASEARLQQANAELERRVSQRTAELQQARDQARQARDQAEQANRAKSDFLSGMSHELRTPLNAVLGFAQLLASDDAPPLSARQRDYVQHIQQGGEHLLALVSELLDLASIEAGKLHVTLQAVDALALLHDCLRLVAPLARAQGVLLAPLALAPLALAPPPLRVALSPGAGAGASPSGHWQVQADPLRLKQVLLNLLGNAIKYNQRGGSVALTLADLGDQVRLDVADTGPGLSAEQQARLFQAFERLDASRSDIPGAGVGLLLSKRITELMGGQIGLRSAVGRGSTFWLLLRRPASAA